MALLRCEDSDKNRILLLLDRSIQAEANADALYDVPTSTSRCRTTTRLWRLVVSQSVVILLPFLSVIYVARNLAMGCSWTNFFRLNAETPIYIELLSIFGMGGCKCPH